MTPRLFLHTLANAILATAAGVFLLAAGTILLAGGAAHAQAPAASGAAGSDDLPTIRITPSGTDQFRLALPKAVGDSDTAAALETETRDLDISGIFHLLDPTSFPAELQNEGMGFSSALWSQVGAQGVAKIKVGHTASGGAQIEGALYVIGRGEGPVLSHTYKGSEVHDAVHQFANDIVGYFTGQPGIFGSRIAVALTGGKSREILTMDMDGSHTLAVTKMGSDCLLPAFSPGGGEIAFTSYLRGNPDLWVVSAGGGRARRVSKQPGLNTGAAWTPSGSSIALTMSYEGNAEIYRISASEGVIQTKLTINSAIDSSPSYSPDGSQIAFVSSRSGNPQIFVMPSTGGAGNAKRVTFQGKYNQTPRWNPRADKPQIAFTGRDERGVFDIFILDMKTGKIDRVTQSRGSNLDPAWSPDGRLLAYVSSRGGLFITNPETRHEVQIWRGSASSPSWGPAPARH
jgi:TolB protein